MERMKKTKVEGLILNRLHQNKQSPTSFGLFEAILKLYFGEIDDKVFFYNNVEPTIKLEDH